MAFRRTIFKLAREDVHPALKKVSFCVFPSPVPGVAADGVLPGTDR